MAPDHHHSTILPQQQHFWYVYYVLSFFYPTNDYLQLDDSYGRLLQPPPTTKSTNWRGSRRVRPVSSLWYVFFFWFFNLLTFITDLYCQQTITTTTNVTMVTTTRPLKRLETHLHLEPLVRFFFAHCFNILMIIIFLQTCTASKQRLPRLQRQRLTWCCYHHQLKSLETRQGLELLVCFFSCSFFNLNYYYYRFIRTAM